MIVNMIKITTFFRENKIAPKFMDTPPGEGQGAVGIMKSEGREKITECNNTNTKEKSLNFWREPMKKRIIFGILIMFWGLMILSPYHVQAAWEAYYNQGHLESPSHDPGNEKTLMYLTCTATCTESRTLYLFLL